MAASEHENRHLGVISRPRQVRVAYLIDPAATPLELLDAIFSACSHVWGGRLSPIVPVIDGEISASYWKLLQTVDPDWIYSYTSVPQALMDRLMSEIAPLHLTRHNEQFLKGERPHYEPSISHDLIRVHELLPLATEQSWFQTPALVTYTGNGNADSLIGRNFGILRNNILSEQISKDVQQLEFGDVHDFSGFLELVAEQRGGLVFPYGATCARAVCESGGDSNWSNYRLFIGEKLSDWIAFWNHIFTVSADARIGWRALCIPAVALSEQSMIDALTKFLRKYAHRSGQHPPTIDWVSSSLAESEIRFLASPSSYAARVFRDERLSASGANLCRLRAGLK